MGNSYTKYKERVKFRGWLGTYEEFRTLLHALHEAIFEEQIDSVLRASRSEMSREEAVQILNDTAIGKSQTENKQVSPAVRMAQFEADFLIPSLRTSTKTEIHEISGSVEQIVNEIVQHNFTDFSIRIPISQRSMNRIEIHMDPMWGIGADLMHQNKDRVVFLKGLFSQLLIGSTSKLEKVVTNHTVTSGLISSSIYLGLNLSGFPYGLSIGSTASAITLTLVSVISGVILYFFLRKAAPVFALVDDPSNHWYRRWPAKLIGLVPPALVSLAVTKLFSGQ